MRLARTPDGTIWLVTDTQAVATGDPAVYASLAKVWGAPVPVDQADITRINGASITPGTLAGDLRGDLKHKGEQLDALAAAVSKVSAPTLDPVAVAAGLAANQDFIDKLADALVKRPSA